MAEKDVEAAKPRSIPHFRQIFDLAGITPEVEAWDYQGSGTEDDPYVVEWIDHDPRNPMLYKNSMKWALTMFLAISTLAVAFVSSAYSGGADQIIEEFGVSQEIFVLGISLFVLGFAIGPLIWAPMSELFGRQILYTITFGILTAFNAGAAGSPNIQTLIVLRFFAGAFGSSPLTNAGGVISDLFSARERGIAMSCFAAAPFLGPVLGPIASGFIGETIGWRWNEGIMAIFTGIVWIIGSFFIPETYPPVLLRKRAAALSKKTGKVYKSRGDVDQGPATFGDVFKASLSRPWVLLFREPIVFLLSVYMAIIYGTLYMLFSAFPIVYQENRGWSPGIGGLSFLGVGLGMLLAVAFAIYDNKRYTRISEEYKGFAPPEARLRVTMIGGCAVPIGLFWFAWTNYPSIHWIVSILAGVPFGFGMVLVFLGIANYLVDAYTIFAASVLAANAVLRSIFGAVFPLFTTQMYDNLGIHWASSIPAFLALICVPMPFLFWKYGPWVRSKCKFAAESDAFMKRIQQKQLGADGPGSETEAESAAEHKPTQEEEDKEQEAGHTEPTFEEIKTTASRPVHYTRGTSYEGNPYDLDRVNTRESFGRSARSTKSTRSRASSRASRK